jgi:aminoacyl tRNA synthase complex-interacting multifunctional protein 1
MTAAVPTTTGSSGHRTTSDAFLATLRVPQTILLQDGLLALVMGLAPSFQLTVQIAGDDGATTTSTKTNAKSTTVVRHSQTPELVLYNGTTLRQRNAILRTICSFFVQLDFMPYTLLAGSSSYGNRSSKDIHRFNVAGIISWMSIFSSTYTQGILEKDVHAANTFLQTLNHHLADHAFLVGSSSPTLADLDLYFMFLNHAATTIEPLLLDSTRNQHIIRWIQTVHPTVCQWLEEVKQKSNVSWIQQNLQAFELPKSTSMLTAEAKLLLYPTSTLPTFFFDDQEGGPKTIAVDTMYSTSPEGPTSPTKGASSVGTGHAPAEDMTKGHTPGEGLSEEQKKEVAEKRAKRAAEKKAAAAAKKGVEEQSKSAANATATSTDDEYDISALDIRVGKIIKVWNHESADKLYCEEIDLGTERRQIASGLRPFYTLQEMDQQLVLVLCNLKPRSLVGFSSHGMVLCASNDDKSKVEFVRAPDGAALGERVIFEGYDGKGPEVESKVAKKKIFEKVSPHLLTNAEGKVVWKGAKAKTTAGECFAVNFMSHGHVS